ncbi:MAG: AraC family transcriptional regulator ligand-binding domain-containing protein [Ketobacteraceae bacterium]|nr:AraC family transcriptional regulator ligand-binding domain-containing protein [Ketobacteraceae bacterium]
MKNNQNPANVDLDLACVPSNYSRLIARELGLQVRDLPGLLGNTGLTTERFLQEETQLTPRQQIQIMRNSLALTSDEAFGLRLGRRFTSPTHGAMGFLANSSPNLRMALNAFKTFLPTRMSLAWLDMRRQQDWLQTTLGFDEAISGDVLRVFSEIFAVTFAECAEFIVGRPLSEARMSFRHAKPDYHQLYSDYLPGSFAFSAPRIMVEIPMEVCEIPNASANHENYLLALQQCEAMLAQLHANKDSCKYRIQKMMLSGPPGVLSEEEVAAALFISKRTMARRLKKEGTSFRQVRDEILSQQAIGYLRDSNMSVDAIAAVLNYHDSSNFRRAFKRWFKLTPDQYRQQLVT